MPYSKLPIFFCDRIESRKPKVFARKCKSAWSAQILKFFYCGDISDESDLLRARIQQRYRFGNAALEYPNKVSNGPWA